MLSKTNSSLEPNKHILNLLALCLVTLLGLSSCADDDSDGPMLSTDEITFLTSNWNSMSASYSRATLFENGNDLKNLSKGGGNFTVWAYASGTTTPYINKSRVWYFNDPKVLRWIFLDKDENPLTYYWPNTTNLDFFAFMPDKAYEGKEGYQAKETYVTLGEYTSEAGQLFSCNLPNEVDQNTEMQEFIYAYETDKQKTKDAVILGFHHPFALINFKVGVDSYRLTIKRIQLDKIYLAGEYSTASKEWSPKADTQTYTVKVSAMAH